MNIKQTTSEIHTEDTAAEALAPRALGKANFIGMAIAGAMIIAGFLLMLGGSSTPEEFNPDIFSTRRIVVGPCIAFLGFVGMAIAIIIDPARFTKRQSPKQ